MYNTEVTADSKYHVADILSSMAHGDHNTPNFSTSAYTSGILSITTPTLTPTSLANIEQTFIELQSVPVTSTTDSAPLRYTQSGFMPPVVEPHYGYESGSEHDWSPASSNTGSVIGGRKHGDKSSTPYSVLARKYPSMRRRDLKNEQVSPEEDERRKVRRDRNKQAAAKCRQRRMDVQSTLQQETECLEDDNSSLEGEIHSLQQQKEQLEFLLQSHGNVCKKHNATSVIVKHESKLDCLHRPNTLPITTTASEIGVPITTPSSGVFTFGFDTMVDGSTGLTPITGVPSCSQQHRDSSESSPDALSPKLISL